MAETISFEEAQGHGSGDRVVPPDVQAGRDVERQRIVQSEYDAEADPGTKAALGRELERIAGGSPGTRARTAPAATFGFEEAGGGSGVTFSFEDAISPAGGGRGELGGPPTARQAQLRVPRRGGSRREADPFVADEPAAAPLGGIADEGARLRDTFFSGVDSTIAGAQTLNFGAQAGQLQRTQRQLQALEANGQGQSREAEGLRQTIAHYNRRMPAMAATAAEAQADAQRGAAMVANPAAQAVTQAKTFGEAWEAFKAAPYDVISTITAQSLPTMLPALVAGAIAGPAAGAMTMGAASGITEAGSSLGDYARDAGVNVADAKELQEFFSDPETLAAAMQYAGKRAGIIGGADAASGGIAGRTLAPAMRSAVARQAINVPTQMGVQAAFGAGGEAGAQLATKGRIDEPGQVFAEAVGEFGGAPGEVLTMGREARQHAKLQRATEQRKALNDQLDDFAAQYGVPAKVVARVKQEGDQRPLSALADTYRRALAALAKRRLTGGATEQDVAALSGAIEARAEPFLEEPDLDEPAPRTAIDDGAHEAATSPENDLAEPSDAQAKANNYKVGRVRIAGMDISIENPEGSTRRGVDADGKPWETRMRAHYGYVLGSEAKDGDHLDVFIKPGTPDDYAGPVFVVDQIDPKTGRYDEAKAIIGASSYEQAEALYRANYAADWRGMGALTGMPMNAFKAWAASAEARKPLGDIDGSARSAAGRRADGDGSARPADAGGNRRGDEPANGRAAPELVAARADEQARPGEGAARLQPTEEGRRGDALRTGPRVLVLAGRSQNVSSPIDLRANADGTLTAHMNDEPLRDQSGAAVVVRPDATDLQAKMAIRAAGAVSDRVLFFPPNAAQRARQPAGARPASTSKGTDHENDQSAGTALGEGEHRQATVEASRAQGAARAGQQADEAQRREGLTAQRATFDSREAADQYLSEQRRAGGARQGRVVSVPTRDGRWTFARPGETAFEHAQQRQRGLAAVHEHLAGGGSLTTAIKRAGKALNAADKEAILAGARELRSKGKRANVAARLAVEQHAREAMPDLVLREPGADYTAGDGQRDPDAQRVREPEGEPSAGGSSAPASGRPAEPDRAADGAVRGAGNALRGRPRVVGLGIAAEIERTGSTALVGRKVASADQLAELA